LKAQRRYFARQDPQSVDILAFFLSVKKQDQMLQHAHFKVHLTITKIERVLKNMGSCHKRQNAQAPTPQAPIRNRKTRKDVNAKVHNRYTNLT